MLPENLCDNLVFTCLQSSGSYPQFCWSRRIALFIKHLIMAVSRLRHFYSLLLSNQRKKFFPISHLRGQSPVLTSLNRPVYKLWEFSRCFVSHACNKVLLTAETGYLTQVWLTPFKSCIIISSGLFFNIHL